MPTAEVSASKLVRSVPAPVRPIVTAARRLVKTVAPKADEIVCMSTPPRSRTYMWKILRYTLAGENVLGIGTFSKHSTIFFYRGRELDDGSGLLEGSGKDSRFIALRESADVDRPAVKRTVDRAFKLAAKTTSGKR